MPYDMGDAVGKVSLDVSGVESGMKKAKDSMESFDTTVNKSSQTVDAYAQSLTQNFTKAYEAVTEALKQQEQAQQRAIQLQNELAEAQAKAAKYQENAQKYTGAAGSTAAEKYAQTLTKIAEIEAELTNAKQAQETATKNLEQAQQRYADVATQAATRVLDAEEKAQQAAEEATKRRLEMSTVNVTKVAQAEVKAQEDAQAKIEKAKIDAQARIAQKQIDVTTQNATKVAQTEITATQNAQAKIEKAKIDAAQKSATQEIAIKQKAQTDIEKAEIVSQTKIEQTKIQEAEKTARKIAETEIKEREKTNREIEKLEQESAEKVSNAQIAAFSVVSRAVNEVISLVKQLAQEMLNLGKEIVTVGAEFEQSMAQVAATSGMTASDVAHNISDYNDLVEAARQAGETTMFTASQAGEALNYLALAGYSVQESIETMPDILTIAAAGAMDLGIASDMVTDAMNALNLEIDDTGEFINKMAKTAQSSNTNVEQLGRAILTVGGTATVLKGGVTELDTAIGLMANSGIKAQQGGTSLRQILLNLTDPTEKAAKKMEELGLQVFDAEGNMRSLQDIFSDLSDIMADFSDEQRMNALGEIFNARHIRAAVALMDSAGDKWTELEAKISNADGAAEKMADTMMSTFNGAIITAKSTLESIAITINEGLRKNLTDLVNEAIPKLREFNKTLASPEVQSRLEKFSAVLKEVALNILDKLIAEAPKIADYLANIKTHLDNLAITLGALTALIVGIKFDAIKTAIMGIFTAITANPILAVVAAVAALVVVVKDVIAAQKTQHEANIAAIKQEIDLYAQQRGEINATLNEWAEYCSTMGQVTQEAEDQVTKVQALYNEYKRLYEAGEDTTLAMEALAEEIPEVSKQLSEGKADYESITKAVDDYTDALLRNARMQANKETYVEALKTSKELEKNISSQKKAVDDSAKAYEDAQKALNDYYSTHQANLVAPLLGGKSALLIDKEEEKLKANLEATEQVYTENAETYKQMQEDKAEADKWVLATEQDYTTALQEEYAKRAEAEADSLNSTGDALSAEAEAAKQAKEDFLAQVDDLDRQITLREKTEDEKFDFVRAWFKTNPDWDKLDDDLVKLYGSLMTYDEKATAAYEKQLEADAKKRQEAAEKAKKEAEQRDKEWQNSVKEAWSDIQWDAKFSDLNDAELADARRQFLADNKAFYDSHVDERESFIQDIAELDKKWLEDEKTTYADATAYLKKIASTYGEDSAVYKSLTKIVDNKKVAENKKAAEEWFDSWTAGYEDLVDKAEEAYKELNKAQEDFEKQYLGNVELIGEKTEKIWDINSHSWKEQTVEAFDPKAYSSALDQLKDLEKIMDSLKAKGLDEGLLNQIWSMDSDEALKTAKLLDKQSAASLQNYSKDYATYTAEVKRISDEHFDEQRKQLEEDYIKPIQAYVTENSAKLQEAMGVIGQDTVQGWIDGVSDKLEDSKEAAGSIGTDALNEVKRVLGIESPSKEFYAIGEFSIEGFLNGLKSKTEAVAQMFVTLGQTAGNKFVEAFKSTWDNFVTLLNSTGGLQVPVSMTTTTFGTPTTQGTQVVYTGTNSSVYGLTKADVISAIKEAAPDGDVILKVDSSEFGRVARSSLNLLAQQQGTMDLRI